jgi:hypothetical protein
MTAAVYRSLTLDALPRQAVGVRYWISSVTMSPFGVT